MTKGTGWEGAKGFKPQAPYIPGGGQVLTGGR